MFKGLMAGVSGVRGIVGEGMTPEVALLWASGFGAYLKGKKVVLSRDSRPTGGMLAYAVKAGLLAAGCDVDDIGIVPTPVGALAVERRGAGGGIIITASHNPQPWNALKFVRHDGRMLTENDFRELEAIVTEGPLRTASWDRIGVEVEWDGAEAMYVGAVLGLKPLDLDRIRRKKYRVAFDGVNGAGSFLYPELLERLGCEVVTIHSDGSGLFPHPPEPLPQNLGDLTKLVQDEKCAIGFAVDPDGDRLAVVDDTGKPIGEEMTLALGLMATLESNRGDIVANCLTTQLIDDIATRYSVVCHRTKVGEANVAQRIIEAKAIAGGEGNGGMILSELHLVRDAGVGIALILNLLSAGKKSVSAIVNELPHYEMTKSSIPVGELEPQELMDLIAARFPRDQISRVDGVRILLPEGWVHIRPSNTEPILRVYAEAGTREEVERITNEFRTILDKVLAGIPK